MLMNVVTEMNRGRAVEGSRVAGGTSQRVPMLAAATLAMALAFTAAGPAADSASAAPLSPSQAVVPSDVLQVRDGCGRGMRFSYRRDRCVEDFSRDDFRRDNFRDERRRDRPRRDVDDGGAAAAAIGLGVLGAIIGAAGNNNNNRQQGSGGNVRKQGGGRPDKRNFGGDGRND